MTTDGGDIIRRDPRSGGSPGSTMTGQRNSTTAIDAVEPVPDALVVLLVPGCLYTIFRVVPTDEKMGVVQRIFYFHVPAALAGFLGVALCAACSACYLWTRDRRYDRVAHDAAELGELFFPIVLLTGPIW